MNRFKRDRPTLGVLAGWQVYPGYIDSFLENVFYGILSAAQDQECNLMLGCGIGLNYPFSLQRPAWPVILPSSEFIPVGPWNCDGLIVATPTEQPGGIRYFQELIASGYPLIYAGERESGPAVVVDNAYGIRQAMQHLVAHGHRRIVFVSGSANSYFSDVQYRRNAYKACVKEFGLDDDPELIIYGEHSTEGGRLAMEQLLKRGIPFSAVLASNDESAIGSINALHAAGKLIPEDVAVIGFDDRFEAKAQVPLLTTVHHPMFELGYRAVEMLLRTILTGEKQEVVRIQPQLIVRESCGCLPGNNLEIRQAPQSLIPQAEMGYSISPDSSSFTQSKRALVQPVIRDIASHIFQTISMEMQRLRAEEVSYLSWRLVDSLDRSLKSGDGSKFQQAAQQIIEYVDSRGDDVYAWQNAVSIIHDALPQLMADPLTRIDRQEVEELLHLVRVVISEISRGQFSRLKVNQDRNEITLGQMTALYFSAQDEKELFEITGQMLPSIGIAHMAVAYYEGGGDDDVAWSQLQFPLSGACQARRFETRKFPPEGLYPLDQPFRLVVLPLVTPGERIGYVAFDTGNIDYCGLIVRQLLASIKGVRLRQEALEARRIAEEQRKLAEEANQLKSRFLSMVSHELRTPLNLISGLSDMLIHESQVAGPDTRIVDRDDLERLYIGSRHLDDLIRDVLDLARIDVGKLNLTYELLDFHEVLEAAAAIGEKLARDKSLAWIEKIENRLPTILGDRTRLRQVVLNLINNAVKFTSYGSITLSAGVNNGKLVVSVSDTGLGIPAGEQTSIFDEFRQSSRTSARGYGGLGLGLAICRHLVESHGGQISVNSEGEEGKGSTFYFTLPAFDENAPVPARKNLLENCQFIMILTETIQQGAGLKCQLEGQGCQVDLHAVDKNSQWLTQLKIDPPDVIILDRELTSTRGWEILKILKDNPETQAIPVLFYAQNDHNRAFLELNYLTKPVKAERLAEVLETQGLFNPDDAMGQPDPSDSKKIILVVDDDPEILNLHTRILESMSKKYQPVQARDGREALAKLRELRPSLMLLDLMMPGMDGFSVLETMLAEELTRTIPVIVITGQTLTEEDMARLNKGVISVLSKGIFTPEETSGRLKNILARQHKGSSEQQKIVLKAMAFIQSHYTEPISRSEVAAHIGMSERHLTRCFHHEVGLTPISYLNRFRVRQAKYLLDAGCNSITEVAMEVGFSSSGYFTRVFKEEVGIAPREYLRR